ncbi:hybrid sensor histidine kinase/response regulator transcription factor [Mariniphaga anaerophila]|nr:hybrid sensor histidine kinase/response regulator transcription factor [Mariniphaga anaerophila]
MKTCIISLLIILLAAINGVGRDFRYLQSENGLPDGEINSIVQDSDGYMWFATWTGLVRYDGFRFDIFRPELGDTTSLPEKKIKILLVDSHDNLWIVGSKSLSRLNKHDNTFTTYQFEDISNGSVNIFHISEVNNQLLVHTVDGLFYFPLNDVGSHNITLKRFPVIYLGEQVNAYFDYSASVGDKLMLASNGTVANQLYLGTVKEVDGLWLLAADTLFEVNHLINAIEYVPVENTFYIATTGGIMPFSVSQGRFVKNTFFRGQNIQQVFYAGNHHIYATLTQPKLLYIDLHTGITGVYESNPHKAGSLLDNEIHSLFEDFSGNLWIGHQGRGISIMDLYRKKFYSFMRDPFQETTLSSNAVMCFCGTENEIIIGCRSNGLNIVEKRRTIDNDIFYETLSIKPENAPATVSDGVWDIEKQSDSLFWVATDLGLYRLLKGKSGWKMEPFSGNPEITFPVRKIFVDSNNNLWCGSHGSGLIFIPNPERNEKGIHFQYQADPANPQSLSDNVILDIFLDSKKRFWVGTNNGFNRLTDNYENLDLSGKSVPDLHFLQYVATQRSSDYLNNNEINCFYENYDGNLWIATQGGGINIFNPVTEKFSHITTEDGLPSDDVISMVPDEDGNLWIATNAGLARYNRFEADSGFTLFNSADGIQSDIFMINSCYKATDGQVFFGGDRGFTCFYPREIQVNEIEPKVSLTQFRIRNKVVEIGDTLYRGEVLSSVLNDVEKITLPFKSNNFSIGVSSIHFQYPEDNRIIYILEGMFETWYTVPASNQFVYFSNIPPGTYTFRTKAVSADRVLSAAERTMLIEVRPPWYQTWVAVIFYAIIGLLMAYGLVYVLVNRQKLIYQKKIDRITIDSNENKMLFLTNIAHELRTPLSLIAAPIDDMVKHMNVDYKWKNHLQLISRNSNYLLRLINQIIDFRKLHAGKLSFNPQKIDIVRVVKDVVMNFKGFESSRNINLQVKVPSESILIYADIQKIEEILYNLISNAFKHTFDHHSIIVSLNILPADEDGERKLQITVFNEGKEIGEADQTKIFDRFYKVDDTSEGAGIGLSFSKSLVEMHKGTIDVESMPGKGVAFHVILPIPDVEVNQLEESVSVATSLAEKNSVTEIDDDVLLSGNGKATVLIVEDNAELGEFLKGIFSRKYNCLFAANGWEAWQIVQRNCPNIIISDVIMPRMDGLELCKKVKESKETCHVPVLMLTAKDSPEQIEEGYSVGVDAYVTKPFKLSLLLSQTERLIKNRALIREKYRTQNFMVEVESNKKPRDEEFVQTVRKILESNISDPEFNVNKLSKELCISTTQLYRRMKELTNHSPVEFIRIVKLQKAYSLLGAGNNTVKEVCYRTGFNNMSYFIKCFREQFGVTPANFRDNGFLEKDAEKSE